MAGTHFRFLEHETRNVKRILGPPNLFGSLSHHGFGSWLVIPLADAAADVAPLIPPEIHDLYNKDIITDMRKFERQLRVLPDLLNSCPS